MASKKTHYRFKLMNGITPPSFQVPLKNVMVERFGENGITRGLKKIEYIKGHESMWAEDHIGDEKPIGIWFEDGYLDVHKGEKGLVDILFNHKWHNQKYELIDKNRDAVKKLNKFDKIELALSKVNIANPDEQKANALVLIGPGVIDWSKDRIKAGLKEKAFNEAEYVISEMSSNDYHAKYISAHALLTGVVVINPTRTAVTWADGNIIVTCPVGQDPLFKLGQFLSKNDKESKITLQEIGERTKKKYVLKDIPKVKEAVDKVVNITEKSVDTEEETEEEEAFTEDELLQNEENIRLAKATVDYFDKFNKKVPARYKNDPNWIESKLVD